ncbi:L,D-transpeptidase family protein [Methylobacterium sp. Leaf118]|uniref:L,D-transpeptidase family protein n=1 Tax=Methylobacterium sp. Leaf118 TaxID=2876562 RepID=UPI001E5ACF13|nr:L,D-transpeptidase [Methylobacterium sp. Leaf118]
MVGIWVRSGLAALVLVGAGGLARAEDGPALTRDAINGATFRESEGEKPSGTSRKKEGAKDTAKAASKRPDPLLVKVQVLLDRARFSPGAIDGRDGENLRGALKAYALAQGLPAEGQLTRAIFEKLQAGSAEPVVTEVTLTEADVTGPFVERMPAKMEEQAEVGPMRYTNTREMLAERFHMQRDLLSAMNPDVPLDKAGGRLIVAAVPPTGAGKVEGAPLEPRVTRIEVDTRTKRVRAFAGDGRLTADYPASIGSEEKPAPDGEAKVKAVAFDPWYTYNPKYRFKGVKATKKFSIQPGPNNPVGLVWIDLSIESYGIHGTPEPEKVGKTESHGCIRLTNWDARDLGSRTAKGAKVTFLDK